MFGTSGIRGIIGEGITCGLFHSLGLAVSSPGSKIALARDTRATGTMLGNSFASGAMQGGSSVLELGIAPAPALAYATKKFSCMGACITASHNPAPYNGIKFFENGLEISREKEVQVENSISNPKKILSWEKAGQLLHYPRLLEEYSKSLLSLADAKAISAKSPIVAIDCANGSASSLAEFLLSSAGCRVASCNSSQELPKDAHPEPTQENLKELSSLIQESHADLGFAFDPDADRCVVLGKDGQMLGLDRQLALMCAYLLSEKKGQAITTVEASLLVRETVENAGGSLLVTPVGSMHVARKLKETGAVFGGEPCGEYVFPGHVPAADGLLSALKFAEAYSKRPKLFSDPKFPPQYFLSRKKYACSEKEKAMPRISSALKSEGKLEGRLDLQDGIRLDFDLGWFLIRPSGTEPAIRLTLECRDKKKGRELEGELESIINSAIRQAP